MISIIHIWIQIHCANGVYIPVTNYDHAKNYAAKGRNEQLVLARFVKEITTAIFTPEELKNCSVTGQGCNRTKSKPKAKLNETKLGAVHGMYK